jgi:hypothetical protein
MKARAAIVCSSALFALTAVAIPASAAPPGQGLETFPATCDGQPVTVTTGGGAGFWLNGEHYVLTTLHVTFETEQGTQTFDKDYGRRTGLTDSTITCTGTIMEPEGPGTFYGYRRRRPIGRSSGYPPG